MRGLQSESRRVAPTLGGSAARRLKAHGSAGEQMHGAVAVELRRRSSCSADGERTGDVAVGRRYGIVGGRRRMAAGASGSGSSIGSKFASSRATWRQRWRTKSMPYGSARNTISVQSYQKLIA